MSKTFDPITFEVVKNALASCADEMALVVMRSAYSPVVRDTMDYSTAICNSKGEIIAQGLTLAIQLGTFPTVMGILIERYSDQFSPGDVFITNDTYGAGGQHLPDIYIIQPIFLRDELLGFAATMAHHSDVGGIVPGSISIHSTEIYQEGLRIPLVKLIDKGRDNHILFQVIEKNTRLPVEVLGDLRAQIAACKIAQKGLTSLAEKYGRDELENYQDAINDLSEKMIRETIRGITNGKYYAEDFIDGFGDNPEPIKICATVTVEDEHITVDFAGSSKQVPAGLNCPIAASRSATYCAIRCLGDEEIPNTQGYMRAIDVVIEEATILNPILPAACSARGIIIYRLFDVIMQALAPVVPDRVIAGCEGGPTIVAIGGEHNGVPFVLAEVLVSNWGARKTLDGEEGVSHPGANLSNQPVEILESRFPLRVLSYAMVPDSGGAGKYRGGLASIREYELLCEKATMVIRADRRNHLPYGLEGGKPGAPSNTVLISSEGITTLPTMPLKTIELKKGDVLQVISAGGGGYGDPAQRDQALIRQDLLQEHITIEAARLDYGEELTQSLVNN